MGDLRWYVAKLRFLILLETTGSEDAAISVYAFRSDSSEAAFARALELGRAAETEYLGGTAERVRWRFKEIETLDVLQAADLDGVEVYFELNAPDESEHYAFDHVFQPETSQPGSSGIT